MKEDLRLENPCQIGFVDEVETRVCDVLFSKKPKNKSVVRKEIC